MSRSHTDVPATVEQHALPAFSGLMFTLDDELHELVFVMYHQRRPFSVETVEHWDHSKKPWFNPEKDKPRGFCPQGFDFEYCRRNDTIYQHNSGGGGTVRVVLHEIVEKHPPCEIWIAAGIPLFRHAKRKPFNEIPLKDGDLERLGYKRLRKPRLLRGWRDEASRNPFDVSEEGETVYCRRCEDHLPDEPGSVCKHLYWCDDCGDWFYLDNRMDSDGERRKCECKNEDDCE
jgi:hypothetical protein